MKQTNIASSGISRQDKGLQQNFFSVGVPKGQVLVSNSSKERAQKKEYAYLITFN